MLPKRLLQDGAMRAVQKAVRSFFGSMKGSGILQDGDRNASGTVQEDQRTFPTGSVQESVRAVWVLVKLCKGLCLW